MKNTGTEYMSTERTPTLREDFAELLPPLSDEQLSLLEDDILANGCYAPVIVNEDIVVVDGHNRKAICDKHGLPYRMVVFSFEDDLEAKQWALDTQKSRRNLSINELCKIAMKLRPEIEARAKERIQEYHGNQYESAPLTPVSKVQNEKINTRKELADVVGVGQVTMGRAMKIEDEAPESVKDAVDSGDLTIAQGYNITREVSELPEDEQEQAAAEAIAFEKAKKDLRKSDAEIDRRSKLAKDISTAFSKAIRIEPTEENVRCWVECTRMTLPEMGDSAKEAREIAEIFDTIAEIIETKIMPKDWRNGDEEAKNDEAADEYGEETSTEAEDTD